MIYLRFCIKIRTTATEACTQHQNQEENKDVFAKESNENPPNLLEEVAHQSPPWGAGGCTC